MKTLLIQSGHPFWEKTISFARNCSWKAGPILASRMEKNDFQDWERVIIAIDHEAVVGYCTLSEKDELPVEYGFSPFIGFVFVDENHRGKRISEKMIEQAVHYAKELSFQSIYLMSGERRLYEKYSFQKNGEYETIYGTVDQLFQRAV